MTKTTGYSSALTGSGFMMYEFKKLVELKLEGLTDAEIKGKVLDENIFQYKKTSSIKRALPYLLNRINCLDEILMNMVCTVDIRTAKLINLYSIMKIDTLFNEFMHEVVQERLNQFGSVLEKRDVNIFFTDKAEQSEFLQQLAESTTTKLKNQFVLILLEANLLKDKGSREMQSVLMDNDLKHHLIITGNKSYVTAMGNAEVI